MDLVGDCAAFYAVHVSVNEAVEDFAELALVEKVVVVVDTEKTVESVQELCFALPDGLGDVAFQDVLDGKV